MTAMYARAATLTTRVLPGDGYCVVIVSCPCQTIDFGVQPSQTLADVIELCHKAHRELAPECPHRWRHRT